jgi:HAD superfamily hydrolase (TIGR01509 family)
VGSRPRKTKAGKAGGAERHVKAALFDLDGTLIDTAGGAGWVEANARVMRDHGVVLDAGHLHRLSQGLTTEQAAAYLRQVAEAQGRTVTEQQINDGTVDHMARMIRDNGVDLKPGALQILADLRKSGVRLALVTASSRRIVDAVLGARPELRTYFRGKRIVTSDDVSRTKPGPEPYLEAARRLRVDVADCVAFEDSRTGKESAQRAGVRTVYVASGDDAGAHRPSRALFPQASLARVDVPRLEAFGALNDPRAATRPGRPLAGPVRRNVALVYWGSEGDGVSSHLRTYAGILAAQGHAVTWYYGSGSAPGIDGVRAERLGILDLDARTPSPAEVAAVFAERLGSADTVHLHNGHNFRPEVAAGLVALRDRREAEKRPFSLLHTFHSPFDGEREARNAQAVTPFYGQFGVSEYMADFYRQRLGVDVRGVRIGVETDRFTAVPDVVLADDESVVFGVAGRFVPNKGVLEAYQAFAQVVADWDERAHGAKPQLRITSPPRSVGAEYERAGGYEQKIKELATAAGLWTDPALDPEAAKGNLVHFENTPSTRMADFYDRTHVVLIPTLKEEAFGVTAGEAQKSGRAVRATEIGGLPEAVEPGSGSLLPRRGDAGTALDAADVVSDLRDAMRALAVDRGRVVAEGARARAFALARLDPERHAERMVSAYFVHGQWAAKGGPKNAAGFRPSADRGGAATGPGHRTASAKGLGVPRSDRAAAPRGARAGSVNRTVGTGDFAMRAGADTKEWGAEKCRSVFD